jgi:hypothetical protein
MWTRLRGDDGDVAADRSGVGEPGGKELDLDGTAAPI